MSEVTPLTRMEVSGVYGDERTACLQAIPRSGEEGLTRTV